MTGVLAADFWIVRRQALKIPDLYKNGGIYWYHFGLNWRAFASFFFSAAWSMPGFICAVNGAPIAVGWTRIYQLSYFIGLLMASIMYTLLCKVWPPEGLGISESLDDVDSIAESFEGVEVDSPGTYPSAIEVGKTAKVEEKALRV